MYWRSHLLQSYSFIFFPLIFSPSSVSTIIIYSRLSRKKFLTPFVFNTSILHAFDQHMSSQYHISHLYSLFLNLITEYMSHIPLIFSIISYLIPYHSLLSQTHGPFISLEHTFLSHTFSILSTLIYITHLTLKIVYIFPSWYTNAPKKCIYENLSRFSWHFCRPDYFFPCLQPPGFYSLVFTLDLSSCTHTHTLQNSILVLQRLYDSYLPLALS